MYRLPAIILALVVAACGSNTNPTTTQSAPEEVASSTSSTVAISSTVGDESTTTTTADAPTTSATTVTPTTIGIGDASIRIDEIVFAGQPYLIIANRGTGTGSTADHWICQFPSYYELPAIDLQPGERLSVPLGTGTVPELVGVVATVDVTEPLGKMNAVDGELGLYTAPEFNSADAIVDYVEWGTTGHARSPVAIAAGIWTTGGFVEVPPELLAIVAQAFPTASPEDWFAEIGG